jgi:hypothetical protein
VYKWRHRDSVEDKSHTPHRLQTILTPAQEAVAVSLRQTLLLPLDDFLAVVLEFLNPNVSRSGLDCCLRRNGVSNLRELKDKAPKPKHSTVRRRRRFRPETAINTSCRAFEISIATKIGSPCNDPLKTCSCYQEGNSDEYDDGREHQALDSEAQSSAYYRDHSGQNHRFCGQPIL